MLSLLVIACGPGGGERGFPAGKDPGAFISEDLGGGVERVRRYNANRLLEEEGYLVNGVAAGTWVQYNVDRVVRTESYAGGLLNGYVLEFSPREQLSYKQMYEAGQKHGRGAKFQRGRLLEEFRYERGKLEGQMLEYHSNGLVKKEINFKNGLQHGPFRYYDINGTLTLEYEYAEGEKLEGGAISPR